MLVLATFLKVSIDLSRKLYFVFDIDREEDTGAFSASDEELVGECAPSFVIDNTSLQTSTACQNHYSKASQNLLSSQWLHEILYVSWFFLKNPKI